MAYFVPTPAEDVASAEVADCRTLTSPGLPVRIILIDGNRRSLSPPPQPMIAAAS